MSGLSRTPGKRVQGNTLTGVRIPLSPPRIVKKALIFQGFFVFPTWLHAMFADAPMQVDCPDAINTAFRGGNSMATFNHQDGHHVETDGARIYYEEQGDRHGPALVFLHGGFGDIETFNAITPQLGKRWRLIGIDSRGQGKSTLGGALLSYKRLQQDVEAVIRHLGLDRVSIIGHSDGGIAALRLAASRTVGVDKLVTIGAHWALGADDPTRDMYAGVTAGSWREMFPHSYDSYQALNPEPDFERLTAALQSLWLDSGEDGYPNEAVRDITAALLVVRGDEDPLVSRANAVELADRVPGAKLLNIPFADHSTHEDQPGWLLAVLDAFLHDR